LGRVSFGTLVAEMRTVSRDITELYDSDRVQPFLDRLSVWLVLIGLRRMLDRARPHRLSPEQARHQGDLSR
jgi:hypothetical protein